LFVMSNNNQLLFDITNNFVLMIISLVAIVPCLLVLAVSVTDEKYIMLDGFSLFPKKFSLEAYKVILGGNSSVFDSYKISIGMTVIGTFISIILVSMIAFSISRPNLKYRNLISMFVYWPMVMSTGLVPFYMVMIKLGFKNSFIGLIIPMLMNPMNVFIMLNFFRGIPASLSESAKIDGANEFKVYMSVILPMSKPVLSTIALFVAMQYWNDWVLGLLLIEDQKLFPLQYLLKQVLSQAEWAQSGKGSTNTGVIPLESVKMATVVVTIGPIIFLYPYLQKYFIKGIMIGAVKG